MMQKELEAVAGKISSFLEHDAGTADIRPEYLRDAVRYYPLIGGKRLRPAILLWCCGLLGGDERKALPLAAAVEVWHNWTLVHDDIIDNDDFRRGRESTHRRIRSAAGLSGAGAKSQALLAGDLQHGWALDIVGRSSYPEKLKNGMILRMIRRGDVELVSGEALDVDYSLRFPALPSGDDVIAMYGLKTGALLSLAAELGAAAATGSMDSEDGKVLGKMFYDAGIAFQLRDDHLGIYGDYEKLGKAVCGDLRECKPTYLFCEALHRAGSEKEREQLLGLCGKERYSEADIRLARELLDARGAARETCELADRYTDLALERLSGFPDNRRRGLLCSLLRYLTGRDR